MLKNCLNEHIETAKKMDMLLPLVEKAGRICIDSLKDGGKILIFGNGGSAADAQHIATELSGRFKKERIALAGIALTTDSSTLTSIANDYGYEFVFSRQIEALCNQKDVVIGISTSGNSKNVIKGIEVAKSKKAKIITLSGKTGGEMKNLGNVNIIIPSDNTPRIQEIHIMVGHLICAMIDEEY